MQRATGVRDTDIPAQVISIHALYAEGDEPEIYDGPEISISIHALYAEGDLHVRAGTNERLNFNPRPLCRGRR